MGVEHDPAQLLAAITSTRKRRNVEIVPADLTRSGLRRDSFDLVHARFVSQETGPEPLLREMVALARPGGFVIVEEPGAEPWEIEPAPPGFDRLVKQVTSQFLRRRAAIGSRLAARCRSHGLVGVSVRVVRLELTGGHPYAAMPLFALAAARAALVDSGAASRAELTRLQRELRRAVVDRIVRHTTFPLWQISGKRPVEPGSSA